MPNWKQQQVHPDMHVYSSDNQDVGHVVKVYEDSFLIHKGLFFPTDRYIPYTAIENIDNDRIQLSMPADDVKIREWEKRPDYEDHPWDPTQLMYDRGHGVHDPFEETKPDK
ncbi:MAG: DUF2171 domain-containing protein [Chloroflexota bacterium]|nr:DUF2171 domain-containing protein [Chloroflexota bacterium]